MRHYLKTVEAGIAASRRAADPSTAGADQSLINWAERVERDAPTRFIDSLLAVVAESGTKAPISTIERTLAARGWRQLRVRRDDATTIDGWMAGAGLRDALERFGDRLEMLR